MNRIPPEFQVVIPGDRIATYPAVVRAHSRLLVVDRLAGAVVHLGVFSDLVNFISGDLVVLNETRVIPARVTGQRPGGGRVDILLLPVEEAAGAGATPRAVRALLKPSNRLKPGMRLALPGGAELTLLSRAPNGWDCLWNLPIQNPKSKIQNPLVDWLEDYGLPPLPPYIKRPPEPADRERYQTVYAREPGSLAAPTAGLHFTPELLAELERRGCDIVKLTLDVGLGTFQPIRAADLAKHRMEEERYHIPPATARAINQAKSSSRRMTMVGTTVVRALESATKGGEVKAGVGVANLFIHPPYQFKIIDRLLTNFHRPDSTLLQLVAALAGWELVNQAYGKALEAGFRFYSYGDAMLVL